MGDVSVTVVGREGGCGCPGQGRLRCGKATVTVTA